MLCGGELNPRDNGRELSQRDEKEEGGGGKVEEEEATIDSLAAGPPSPESARHRGRPASA